ncbi:MAG: transporter substrate-binding domain-containing protein [Burkholderiaceae bacterium]|nr:transporter substrate-binding domain-containing protein [Burkholderiaceae bacterium]
MLRIFVLTLLLVCTLGGQAFGQGAAAVSATYPPDIQKIKDRGQLVVAMLARDLIPMFMSDSNGKLYGNDVDLAKAIADALGVGLTFDRSAQTFNGVVDIVASGQADIGLSALSRTLARAERVQFSRPYVVLRPVLILNRISATKYNLDGSLPRMASFNGLVGAPKGNAYLDFAKKVSPKATIVEFSDWHETFRAVAEGRVAAIFGDEVGVKNSLVRFPEHSVELSTSPIDNPAMADNLSIAVNSQSVHLLGFINLYLDMNYPTRKADDLLRIYAPYYKK